LVFGVLPRESIPRLASNATRGVPHSTSQAARFRGWTLSDQGYTLLLRTHNYEARYRRIAGRARARAKKTGAAGIPISLVSPRE